MAQSHHTTHFQDKNTGLLEFTSWPKQKCVFYKLTTSAIRIQVKGHANALIGLATKPGVCQYLILIEPDFRNHIRMKLLQESYVFDVQSNILSPTEFKIFDISWNEGKLSVQTEGFTYLHYEVGPEITFMTFGVTNGSDPVHWKFQVTPNQVARQLQQITLNGMPSHNWVEMTSKGKNIPLEMPEDALLGGYEKDRLYVIRAKHRGSLTPGKFCVRTGSAYIPWGGASNMKTEFEVLCSINCKWVKSRDNIVPVDAVEACYSEDMKERIFIGRAYYMKHLIVGKVQPSHSCCYIPYEGREISLRQFEVLVECKNPIEKYAANVFTIADILQVGGMEADEEVDGYIVN